MATFADESDSATHEQSKRRALDLFEEWRTSHEDRKALCPVPWAHLTAEQICKEEVFDGYACFLTDEKLSESGKNQGCHLSLGTILQYLGCLLNQAEARFAPNGSAAIKLFFT